MLKVLYRLKDSRGNFTGIEIQDDTGNVSVISRDILVRDRRKFELENARILKNGDVVSTSDSFKILTARESDVSGFFVFPFKEDENLSETKRMNGSYDGNVRIERVVESHLETDKLGTFVGGYVLIRFRTSGGVTPVKRLDLSPDEKEDIENNLKLINSVEPSLVYHGSKDKNLKPSRKFIGEQNDYNSGFYCTHDEEFAKEWARNTYTSDTENAFVYTYSVDFAKLKCFDFNNYDIKHWLAEILANRGFRNMYAKCEFEFTGSEYIKRIEKFIASYKVDLSPYDVVMGYRSDSKHHILISHLVNGNISVNDMRELMRIGDLGNQQCLKSEEAYKFTEKTVRTDVPKCYKAKFCNRLDSAINEMESRLEEKINGK